MVYELLPKICPLFKVGYAHYKGIYGLFFIHITIVHNLMYYPNKCKLFCTCEQSTGGKGGGMVCELLLKLVNNNGYNEMRDW